MKKRRYLVLIIFLSLLTCLCCCLSIFVFSLFTPFVEIQGPSMEPNFKSGEIWVLNRFSTIERGDVVVLKKPGRQDLIKRVIALPGEKVLIEDGKIFINENLLNEFYIDESVITNGGDFVEEGEVFIVPANNYFVMGDNRSNSLDSRFVNLGSVKSEWVEGELLIRIWPLGIK